MNLTDTGRVLAAAAAFDRRTVGELDVRAWHKALSDLDVDDCLDAVVAHYRDQTEWLMPAHVRRLAEAARLAEQGRRVAARRDAELQRELDTGPRAPLCAVRDRSADLAQLLDDLAEKLGPGRPEALRRAEVLAWDRDRERREHSAVYAEPNPAFAGFPAPELSEVEDRT